MEIKNILKTINFKLKKVLCHLRSSLYIFPTYLALIHTTKFNVDKIEKAF